MIRDRCRFFKWNLKMPYRVLTIRPGGRNEAEDGGDYLELEKKRLALQRQFPEATAFLYGSQIKLVIHVYDQTTQDALVLGDVAEFCGTIRWWQGSARQPIICGTFLAASAGHEGPANGAAAGGYRPTVPLRCLFYLSLSGIVRAPGESAPAVPFRSVEAGVL